MQVAEICDGLEELIVLHLLDSAWVPTVTPWVKHGPVPGFGFHKFKFQIR